MANDQTISRLLGTLYAAPTAPELWEDFLRGTCDLIGAQNAALIAHDTAKREHRVFGSFGDSIGPSAELYANTYWEYDEWTRRGLPRLGAGKVLLGTEVWPQSELFQSVFYNEFLKHFDICSVASVAVGSIQGQFEALSVYRGHAYREFSEENIAILEMLLPHLQIAMATRRRLAELESRVADVESAFDLLEGAVVLLDAAGRLVLANGAARSILDKRQELFLSKSRLNVRDVNDAAKLRDLIARSSATATFESSPRGGVMSVRRSGKKPLQLLVSPLRSEIVAVPIRAAVVIFLSDPERQPAITSEALRVLFGLTPAEARLALSIFAGHSLSETAEMNRVSRETVKSQMASVLVKTGTRRQSELVRLVARLPIAN